MTLEHEIILKIITTKNNLDTGPVMIALLLKLSLP